MAVSLMEHSPASPTVTLPEVKFNAEPSQAELPLMVESDTVSELELNISLPLPWAVLPEIVEPLRVPFGDERDYPTQLLN